jgi:hypothetical protein
MPSLDFIAEVIQIDARKELTMRFDVADRGQSRPAEANGRPRRQPGRSDGRTEPPAVL